MTIKNITISNILLAILLIAIGIGIGIGIGGSKNKLAMLVPVNGVSVATNVVPGLDTLLLDNRELLGSVTLQDANFTLAKSLKGLVLTNNDLNEVALPNVANLTARLLGDSALTDNSLLPDVALENLGNLTARQLDVLTPNDRDLSAATLNDVGLNSVELLHALNLDPVLLPTLLQHDLQVS